MDCAVTPASSKNGSKLKRRNPFGDLQSEPVKRRCETEARKQAIEEDGLGSDVESTSQDLFPRNDEENPEAEFLANENGVSLKSVWRRMNKVLLKKDLALVREKDFAGVVKSILVEEGINLVKLVGDVDEKKITSRQLGIALAAFINAQQNQTAEVLAIQEELFRRQEDVKEKMSKIKKYVKALAEVAANSPDSVVTKFDLGLLDHVGPVTVKLDDDAEEVDLIRKGRQFNIRRADPKKRAQQYATYLLKQVIPAEKLCLYSGAEVCRQYKALPERVTFAMKRVFCGAYGILIDEEEGIRAVPNYEGNRLGDYATLNELFSQYISSFLSNNRTHKKGGALHGGDSRNGTVGQEQEQ